MQILSAQDARQFSTFRLAATLSQVIEIDTLAELATYNPKRPPLILGEGSNSIFLTDYKAEILRYTAAHVHEIANDTILELHVEAGHNWHQLVMATVSEDWWGLENLALIPGSVGAAPVQNIGAYGVELATHCTYVDFFHWQQQKVIRLSPAECLFGYRDSVFKRQLLDQGIIVAVGFRLSRHGKVNKNYQGLEHLADTSSPLDVAKAVITLRQTKLPDPLNLANCGSFFKNPIIDTQQFALLKRNYPNVPHYPEGCHHYKIAAAWLIDQCGFKGVRHGDIGCYLKQPLVLVNYGAGTPEQLIQLVGDIKQAVEDKFNIRLEPEVRLIGHHD